MKTLLLAIFCVVFSSDVALADEQQAQIESLINSLTLKEKIAIVTGNDPETHPVKRLGIPSLNMNDGPLGVRRGRSTAFPAGIALAATFNPQLAFEMGSAIADEAKLKGVNMILGPCLNISRTPLGGRNFESFGEDPYVASQFVAPYVRGVQSKDVIATLKHFAVNDQETDRKKINVVVDPRTLFEIHLPAFKAGVDAGALAVMSSYNKVNGRYASENSQLLTTILKDSWGFNGFVVSDWEATHSTVESALAGLDLEMPSGKFFGSKLMAEVKNGRVATSVINDKVRRILRAIFAIHLLGGAKSAAGESLGPQSPEHKALALKIAEQSIVLLKNEDALPLKSSIKTIAVLGPNAARLRTGGGGSSKVLPYEQVSPIAALRKILPSETRLVFARGTEIDNDTWPPISKKYFANLKASYFSSTELKGKPFLIRDENEFNFPDDIKKKEFGVRWQGTIVAPTSGVYKVSTLNTHNIKVVINDKLLIVAKTTDDEAVQEKTISLRAGRQYPIVVESSKDPETLNEPIILGWDIPDDRLLEKAVEAAKNSEAAIVFAGLGNEMESEGSDRTELSLPDEQVALIEQVSKVNRNTIVILTSGTPITMNPWLSDVSAVLQAWYPGQEGGWALANILTGKTNPSGKLPISLIKRPEDASSFGNFPGKHDVVRYAEGIFVGYRFLDKNQIDPQFEFGFGKSYSKFVLSDLKVNVTSSSLSQPQVEVVGTIKNISAIDGAEVVQLYVGENHPTVPRPEKELKGFSRVELKSGESKTVSFTLDKSAFSFYDVGTSSWKMNPGEYSIYVGTSSRQLPLATVVNF